ncbi:MAG TPA: O-antigen ligase family protein [Pirellulaceae bacterium]|nr:O-antigen ligase family protein [Pirellulaceae bacterium]HMO90780.1 O-antigen ligase family protein [Pirellulaceae bacterium]HMP68031.1 O-antigen ligase family protein [Pirellulaceae bacterium]
MEVVLVSLAVATAIWGLFLLRHTSIVLQCFVVIVAGSVFGHSFFNVSLGPIPITSDRILLLMVLVQLFLFGWVHGQTIRPRLCRVDILVFILFVLLTTSTFINDFKYKDNLPLGRLLFFNWMPMALYLAMRHCKISTGDLKLIYAGLALFGVYLALTAIAEVREYTSLVFPRYIMSPDEPEFLGRARGPFLNPISCGIFQSVALAGLLMLWPYSKRFGKCIILGVACLLAVGVLLTLTRSVWLSAAVGIGVVVWIPLETKYKAVLAVVVLGIGTFSVFFLKESMESFKRDKHVTAYEMSQSAKLRPMLGVVAYRMFQDRPLFGAGFGQYTKYKTPYHFQDEGGMPLRSVLPYMQHNVYLSYLTETGLIGLVTLLSVLAGFSLHGWKLWRAANQSLWARQAGLLVWVVIANYTINGMLHDTSIAPMLNMLLFFSGGLAVQLSQQTERATEELLHKNADLSVAKEGVVPAIRAVA